MMTDIGLLLASLPRVIEVPYLDGFDVEAIDQTCIDAHFAEVFPKRCPVGAAAAVWTVMNTDHLVTQNVSFCLA